MVRARIDPDDLLTTTEAAKLLKVSPVTIARWLKQGRLPAYRVGPRGVRIRRDDLAGLLKPVHAESTSTAVEVRDAITDVAIDHELIASIKPLGEAAQARLREAIERATEHRQRMLAKRGGQPLPPSWPLIREARDERSDQL